jgi:hypothetical protein
MAVIINEFEIVALQTPKPDEQPEHREKGQAGGAVPLSLLDIDDATEMVAARRMRVYAH